MEKPNTLQEAVLMIESANLKINELSGKNDTLEAEIITLKKKSEDLASEVFGLKSSVDAEQKLSADLKAKLSAAESSKSAAEAKFSELQGKYDALAKKDMDVEKRASGIAAQITGESGIEVPVETKAESEDLSMEEIADKLSKANGREKAKLMDKYGEKISMYFRKKK